MRLYFLYVVLCSETESCNMAVKGHNSAIKEAMTVARKARVRHSAHVMKPEYLAEIGRFRLMDDDFMSKCF